MINCANPLNWTGIFRIILALNIYQLSHRIKEKIDDILTGAGYNTLYRRLRCCQWVGGIAAW
jgi:hypothetical protein